MIMHELHRRDWMRRMTFGFGAASISGWLPRLASASTRVGSAKSVILLWMSGGPATIDLWDLKPGHENGGPFSEIETATPGIRVSEHLPTIAKWMNHLAIVRSITSAEGDHGRGTHFVRTGYQPQGAIRFPAFGSVVSHEIAEPSQSIPNFVTIAPTRRFGTLTGGFLGPNYSPFAIESDEAGELTVANLHSRDHLDSGRVARRQQQLEHLNQAFLDHHSRSGVAQGFHAATERAFRLMNRDAATAFDVGDEPESIRSAYGQSAFGQGCLMARRLIERDVRFVEVSLDGWDTHSDNFRQVAGLSAVLDRGFGTLMEDLHSRGLLDSTIVMCLGEFGRTPVINDGAGRDHYPAAWSAVLGGAGIKGGQTFGTTTPDGMEVDEHRVSPPDLLATVCSALGIDPRKQNMSNVGRPIRVVDPKAQPISELL